MPVYDCINMTAQYSDPAKEIERFIGERTQKEGRPPTVREIQSHMGYKSPRAVSYFLEKLEKAGRIVREAKSRGLFLASKLEKASESVAIPFFDSIPAGFGDPTTSTEPDHYMAVQPEMLGVKNPSKSFAVRVRGLSMVGAGILDGDVAILEKREASMGDIVAALIDGETTLKRLARERGRVILKAENPDFPDLEPEDKLEVQGVMVGLVRRFRN